MMAEAINDCDALFGTHAIVYKLNTQHSVLVSLNGLSDSRYRCIGFHKLVREVDDRVLLFLDQKASFRSYLQVSASLKVGEAGVSCNVRARFEIFEFTLALVQFPKALFRS